MKQGKKQAEDFSWEFPEFERVLRSKRWYVVAAILGIFFVIHSIITYNFIFLVILILFGFVLYLYEIKDIKQIPFIIDHEGIEVQNRRYEWKELKEFFIIFEPPLTKNLYFISKNIIRPPIVIPLLDKDPVAIRKFLLQYLRENTSKEFEPPADSLGRWLKI